MPLFKDDSSYIRLESNLFKASAHSFKRFTSRPFLKIYFSFSVLTTSDEYHAWFNLNAASQAYRNTEQVNIKKIVSTVG